MKHKARKFKVRNGQDANEMLVRKLVKNFLTYGSLETTQKKAKVALSVLDRLVFRAQDDSRASHNVLLKFLGDMGTIALLRQEMNKRQGLQKTGNFTLVKSFPRASDNASIARLVWKQDIHAGRSVEDEAKETVSKEESSSRQDLVEPLKKVNEKREPSSQDGNTNVGTS